MFFLNQLQKLSQPQIKPAREGKCNIVKQLNASKRKVKAKYDKCLEHVAFNVGSWAEKATTHTKGRTTLKW